MTDANTSARLSELLHEHRLSLHGFCRFSALSDRLIPCRAGERMKQTFADSPAQTVIVALFPYLFDNQRGNLSQYARVPDYHRRAGDVLERAAWELAAAFPSFRFLPLIDNSPLPEVRAAALAGLGCVGQHGLLIHPQFGSWVFIGCIVTDLPVPAEERTVLSCSGCGACVHACPGRCLPHSRDTCVSRISQRKGILTPPQEELLQRAGMAWGCDRCQEVCPLNKEAQTAPHPCFGKKPFPPSLTPSLLEDSREKAWSWRGAEVPARNLHILNNDSGE